MQSNCCCFALTGLDIAALRLVPGTLNGTVTYSGGSAFASVDFPQSPFWATRVALGAFGGSPTVSQVLTLLGLDSGVLQTMTLPAWTRSWDTAALVQFSAASVALWRMCVACLPTCLPACLYIYIHVCVCRSLCLP
jgi:hypothetical protein